MSDQMNALNTLSDNLAKAVERGAKSTVLVDARRRFPASGIVYAPDLILTADHVVERDDELSVMLDSGEDFPVTVAGRNPGNDLALLRLEKSVATPAERVTMDARVGEIVVALGRPTQAGIEASLGMVSAIGGPVRTGRGGLLDRYLRTDAVPFPGFSGGPLIDTLGRVVGLNTSGFAHGAAITIPAALAWADAENLAKHGYVKRGYLGIRSQGVTLSQEMQSTLGRQQESGLLLVSVESGSPAEAGGLMVGDIVVAMEGKPIFDHDQLLISMSGETVGKPTSLQVLRGGTPHNVSVIIGERK